MTLTPPQFGIPRRGETREDRYIAMAFSALVHAGLLAFLIWVGIPEVSDMLEGELGGGGGGDGGSDITLVSLSGPPQQVAVEPVPVTPPPVEPEVVPDPEPTPVPPQQDSVPTPPTTATPIVGQPVALGGSSDGAGGGSAGSGGGAGGGSGGGIGTGTGTGTGAGSGGGTGGGGTSPDGIIPPTPTAVFFGPSAPKNLRGKSVVVILTVDVRGKVTDARLEESTGNRKYDSALRESALDWRFRPARNRAGDPVKATFPIVYTI